LENIMNKIFVRTAAATLLFAPLLGFAQQSDAGPTRAQVKADLVRLEQAGYNPAGNRKDYPADIQNAESHLHSRIAASPARVR
jgi:hypothetical protein